MKVASRTPQAGPLLFSSAMLLAFQLRHSIMEFCFSLYSNAFRTCLVPFQGSSSNSTQLVPPQSYASPSLTQVTKEAPAIPPLHPQAQGSFLVPATGDLYREWVGKVQMKTGPSCHHSCSFSGGEERQARPPRPEGWCGGEGSQDPAVMCCGMRDLGKKDHCYVDFTVSGT